jgi:ABC-2 type transport system permease protein
MLAVLGKEFRTYFYSATGYVFMGVFLLICGIFFVNYNLLPASPLYSNVLGSMTFIFLLLVPILTMKLLAEEKYLKTDQLLFTSPLSISEIVVGKYLASVALFFATLLVTLIFPMILSLYGSIAVGEITAGYIGFALMGVALISIGVFVSSLTENQVVSAVASFGALLFIWILEWIQQSLPADSKSGALFAGIIVAGVAVLLYLGTKNFIIAAVEFLIGAAVILFLFFKNEVLFKGLMSKFFRWISLTARFDNFSMGIIDIASVVFYISFAAAFIYLTIGVIEKRRWS